MAQSEPGLDVEFIQVLQDMIGDLTGAPEPVVVKLFHRTRICWPPGAAGRGGPREKTTLSTARHRSLTWRDGIENTTSGPAVRFNLDPEAASRAGFTAEDLGNGGSLDGGRRTSEPAAAHQRTALPVRVRYPRQARASLEALSNSVIVNAEGKTATLGSLGSVDELPGQREVRRENLQQLVEVTARLEGVDMGTGIAAVQKKPSPIPNFLRRYVSSMAARIRAATVVSRSPRRCWCWPWS